jgi:hypothetical protein
MDGKLLSAGVLSTVSACALCYGILELIAAYRAARIDMWAQSALLGAVAVILSGFLFDEIIRFLD